MVSFVHEAEQNSPPSPKAISSLQC